MQGSDTPSAEPRAPDVGREWPIAAFWLTLALLPLLVPPALPLIDYGGHLARYYVLGYGPEALGLSDHLAVKWRIVPNLGLDVIGAMASRLGDPLPVSKLLVTLILVLQFGGVVMLARALGARSLLYPAALAAILCHSYILNWGFVNFILATAIGLWSLALWVRLRDRTWLSFIVGSVLAMAIMISHGFAFALYGVALAAIEFGLWRVSGAPVKRLLLGAALVAGQAVLPALFFLSSSTAATTDKVDMLERSQGHLASGRLASRLLFEINHRLETIFRVTESPSALIDVAFVAGIAIALIWALRSGRLRLQPAMIPALILFSVLVVITPPTLFGVGFVADRVPFMLALLFAASVDGVAPGRNVALMLTAVLLVRSGAIALGWLPYRTDYRDAQALLARVPKGSLVQTFIVRGSDRRDGRIRRCQMYAPLAMARGQLVTPIFANAAMQPLQLKGELASIGVRASVRSHWDWRAGRWNEAEQIEGITRDRLADFVLACDSARIVKMLPAGAKAVTRGHLTLIELRETRERQ